MTRNRGRKEGKKEGTGLFFFFFSTSVAMADQRWMRTRSGFGRGRVKRKRVRGGDGNKRGLDICTPVERTKQRAHLWHSFSDPRRDKRNDEVRAKVQGKSRGIDKGGDACAGLSNRKSEFILNVSLCESVCVFRWLVFFPVVLNSREFSFGHLDTE